MSHKIFRLVSRLFLVLAVLGSGLNTQVARAAGPWYVTPTGDDNNDCLSPGTACATINGAISKASSGDTIYVAVGTYTGTGNEVVLLDKDATLSGGWDETFTTQSGTSTIDGQGARRGIFVNGGLSAVIELFKMQNSRTAGGIDHGGGIYNGGTLTLNNSTVSGNRADGGTGGGIINIGTMTLNGSAITDNIAIDGGGISNFSNLVMNNSTVSGNISSRSGSCCAGGGGIYNYYGSNLTLNNSTINGNVSLTIGGGIANFAAVTLQNSILANNTGSSPDCSGTIGSSGYNLIGDTSNCDFTATTGDLTNTDPLLGPLQNNGGPTFTHALFSFSPAIDAGNPVGCTDQNSNLLTVDQRGIVRPQGIRCDIGAYERVFTTPGPAASLAVLSGSGQLSQLNIAFSKPLRAVALDSQGNGVSGVTVTFTAPGSGASGTFADTGTNTTSVDTDASGVATTPIFTANDQPGTYTVSASAPELGSVNFSLEQIFRPANDNFANAEAITSLSFTATVDITDTTNEPGEQQNCYSMDRTVWYSFTPTETIVVRANTQGSAINGNVNIYHAAGSGISDLQFLNCTGPNGSLAFIAEAGQTYYLQIGSAFGEVGNIQVNLEQIFAPANDNFADAEAIASLPFNSTVDITIATNEPGEQQICYSMDRTVWYSFTPTETMLVRTNTQGSAVNGNVNIYRATGSGISDLQFLDCSGPNDSPTFIAEANQTYYLQAGAPFGGLGSIQINLEQIPSVGNDDFADAITIGALPFSDTRDTSTATSAPDDPTTCFNNGSVWYQFTPPSDTTIAANTFGSDYDTTLAVFTGSRGALELVPGGCNDDFSGLQSFVEFDAMGGTTYYFMLGFCCGNGGTGGGNLVFSVEETTPPSTEVTIDIKPGSRTNPINPKSSGKIPVAILSTPNFNAPLEVDRSSLTFGSTGDELSLVSCNKKGADVNGDGLRDLVCHFKTKLTGFKFGDTEGILNGQTLAGVSIEARDMVRVLHASYP